MKETFRVFLELLEKYTFTLQISHSQQCVNKHKAVIHFFHGVSLQMCRCVCFKSHQKEKVSYSLDTSLCVHKSISQWPRVHLK